MATRIVSADARLDPASIDTYLTMEAEEAFARNMDILDGLKVIATESGSTPSHLALNWLLSKQTVSSVIAGAKNASQVRDNVDAENSDVSPEHLASVDALTLA